MTGRLSLLGAGKQAVAKKFQTPTDIAGLDYWADFSDANTMFTDAGTTHVSANDDKVYQVNDKSATGRTAIQTTEANRPLYKTNGLNGKSVLNFAGDQWLDLSSACASAPVTVFLAAYRTYNKYETYLGYSGSVPSLRNYAPAIEAITSTNQTRSSELWGRTSGHMVLAVTHVSNGGALDIYDKNISYASADKTGTFGGFNTIGSSASQKLSDNIYEIIIYNSVLAQADMEAVTTYLMTKWGIT